MAEVMKNNFATWILQVAAFGCAMALTPVLCCTERPVTAQEAKSLVVAWLASQGVDTRSPRFLLDIDPEQRAFPDFYFLSAAYEQSESVPSLGHFAVNRGNAELWDWELCKRLHSAGVISLQKSLRKKIKLSAQEYERLSKVAPCSGPT